MGKTSSTSIPKAALASVSYFSGLDDEILASISSITVLRHYEPGEVVFMEGGDCEGLYIVQTGWLKGIITSPEGREQIIRLVGPEDAFNEHGVFLNDGKNLVTVQAVEAANVWVVNRSALLALIDRYPVLCRMITQNLASRVVHLMKLVEDLSFRTVEGRLGRLLLEQQDGETDSRRWVTQAEMAARLGTVVDVVNRALHKLEDDGLIRIIRHRIEIVDRKRLEQKIEGCS